MTKKSRNRNDKASPTEVAKMSSTTNNDKVVMAGMERLQIQLTRQVIEAAKIHALRQRTTRYAIASEALRQYLKL